MAIIYYPGKKSQQGVVLVVSLVFLIALTAVAAALMQNTTTDMKMSGASQDKVLASQEAISAVDEVFYNEVSKTGDGSNLFANSIASFGAAVAPDLYPKTNYVLTDADATGEVYIENPNGLEADCAHSRGASSVQVFTCNVLRVRITKSYGRTKGNSIVVNSGASQELLR